MGSRAIFGRTREAHRRRGREEDRRQLRGEIQPAWSASRDCRQRRGRRGWRVWADGEAGGASGAERGGVAGFAGVLRGLERGWLAGGGCWSPGNRGRSTGGVPPALRPPSPPQQRARPPPSLARVSHRSRKPRYETTTTAHVYRCSYS